MTRTTEKWKLKEWWEGGGRRGVTLRDRVARGTVGEVVLGATPFIRGCVRANRVISTSQKFLTSACWSLHWARTVFSRLCSGHTRQAWGDRPDDQAVTSFLLITSSISRNALRCA